MPPIQTVVIPELKRALTWELRSAITMLATLIAVIAVGVFSYSQYFSSGDIPPLTITGVTVTLMLALAFTFSQRVRSSCSLSQF